eukprot:217439-Pelagomonas_calceolata.AAC.2
MAHLFRRDICIPASQETLGMLIGCSPSAEGAGLQAGPRMWMASVMHVCALVPYAQGVRQGRTQREQACRQDACMTSFLHGHRQQQQEQRPQQQQQLHSRRQVGEGDTPGCAVWGVLDGMEIYPISSGPNHLHTKVQAAVCPMVRIKKPLEGQKPLPLLHAAAASVTSASVSKALGAWREEGLLLLLPAHLWPRH